MKRLNRTLIALSLCVGFVSPLVSAGHHPERATVKRVDYATVISKKPVFKTIERRVPIENCWSEQVREQTPVYHAQNRAKHDSTTSIIVGSLIGGALGNAVGAGDENKKVGTVVGAVLGASIGRDVSRQRGSFSHNEVRYRTVERCEVQERIQTEQVPAGYTVTYRYHGQTYTTHTRRDPGRKLKIAVSIQPVEY